MRLLLDTQAFLLWFQGAKGLPRQAQQAIGSGRNECFVSHLSAVELAIKAVSGKLALSKPIGDLYPQHIAANGFKELPLRFEHIARFGAMPRLRGDPFDRLIAAQALHEMLDIVSGDSVFEAYGVKRIW